MTITWPQFGALDAAPTRARGAGRTRGWTFALLVLAWLCANAPQAAGPAVIEWIRGMEHFSHQNRLGLAVAELVTRGPSAAEVERVTAPAEDNARRAARPALPLSPEAIVKLPLLAIDDGGGGAIAVADEVVRWARRICTAPDGSAGARWRPPWRGLSV